MDAEIANLWFHRDIIPMLTSSNINVEYLLTHEGINLAYILVLKEPRQVAYNLGQDLTETF